MHRTRIHLTSLFLVGILAALTSHTPATFANPDFNILEKLVEIKVEPQNNSRHNIHVDVDDDGTILRVIRSSSSSQQVINAADLIKGPVTLANVDGRDVLQISCLNCSLTTGGTLRLNYMYDGILKTYRTKTYQLRASDFAWELYEGATKVHNLTVESRKFLGKVIGIKDVRANRY